MKKLSIALLGTLFSLTALGQDLLQCVNPDVLNSLLYRGQPQMRMSISPSLPESMSSFQAPAGFSHVGTAVRGEGRSTMVAFRTSIEGDDAYAALVASFGAAGWEVEEDELSRPTRGIFSLGGGPVSGTVCRDGQRRQLRMMDVNDIRYPTVLISEQEQPRACHSEDRRLSMMRARMSPLTDDAPTLQFPEGTRSAAANGTLDSGGSGSGDTYQTAVRVLSGDSPPTLIDHLGAQMSDQGWQVDASWSGRLSTGAQWTREADDGTPIWATIEIIEIGTETYDVSYRQMMPL